MKRKQRRRSAARLHVPLFSHVQKAGFLMTRLKMWNVEVQKLNESFLRVKNALIKLRASED